MDKPTSHRIGLACAGLALFGVLLPWASTPLGDRSGLDTSDGKLVAVLAILALLGGLLGSRRVAGGTYAVIGGLGTAVALYDMRQLQHDVPPAFRALISVGTGLYVDLVAFAVLLVVGISLIRGRK